MGGTENRRQLSGAYCGGSGLPRRVPRSRAGGVLRGPLRQEGVRSPLRDPAADADSPRRRTQPRADADSPPATQTAPPQPPPYYSYRVHGTCADGACGLKIRNGPGYTNYQQIGLLNDGDEVRVVCQARGERVGPSPRTGNSSSVWNRLQSGGWVSDLYTTTPNVDQFSPPIPAC